MSALGIWMAVANGLGGYNLSRFLAMRAIKKRREIRKRRKVEANIVKAHDFIERLYKNAQDGIDDREAAVVRAVVSKFKDQVYPSSDERK